MPCVMLGVWVMRVGRTAARRGADKYVTPDMNALNKHIQDQGTVDWGQWIQVMGVQTCWCFIIPRLSQKTRTTLSRENTRDRDMDPPPWSPRCVTTTK